MVRVSLVISAFLLLLLGCAKDCAHNLLPESIKPFLFKTGSYWVFANAVTGGRDTFTVVKSTSEIITGASPIQCKGDPTVEVFEMDVVNGLDTFVVQAFGSPYLNLSNKSHTTQGSVFDASISSGQCSRADDRLCLTSISGININGNSFGEVYQVNTVFTDISGGVQFFGDLYWVKNVGLVKLVTQSPHATTLSIVEWHVVQ